MAAILEAAGTGAGSFNVHPGHAFEGFELRPEGVLAALRSCGVTLDVAAARFRACPDCLGRACLRCAGTGEVVDHDRAAVAAARTHLRSDMATMRNGADFGRRNGARRSEEWFERRDLDGFLHRSWLKSTGVTDETFRGRPVIGICNSWSELVNCNIHLRGLAESVKRGVLQAGGFPVEFPVMSLGESLMKPTTMLYRNLMAMDVEESIRAYPLDGVVLLTGCDKTNPA